MPPFPSETEGMAMIGWFVIVAALGAFWLAYEAL